MHQLIETIFSNPLYMIIAAVLIIFIVIFLVKKIFKILMFAVLLFLMFLAYLHFTGGDVNSVAKKVTEKSENIIHASE